MSKNNKTKILVISAAAGGFTGATLRHQMEVVEKEKYQCVRGTSTQEIYREWEKKGAPVKYMIEKEFKEKQKENAFYWVAYQEPLYGILKEDATKAFKSKEKLYYMEMPFYDCIHIKTLFPEDIYYLAVDEWCEEHGETEDTRLMREQSDFFIDSFNLKELEILENIRKKLLGIDE